MAKQKNGDKPFQNSIHSTGSQNKLPTVAANSEQLFVTWTDQKEFQKALGQIQDVGGTYGQVVERSSAGYYRNFVDIDTNVSVRSPFTRQDYSFFRPTERVPRKTKEIIGWCMIAYEKVGIVKNIIDLMAEFACQGIDIVHEDPKVEAKYRAWWKKVNGSERSERFVNLLYRCGSVIVKRATGKLTNHQMRTMKFNIASGDKDDLQIGPEKQLPRRDLPVKYYFLNPLLVDLIEPELSIFVDQPIYGITIGMPLLKKIRNPTSAIERKLVSKLPESLQDLANNNQGISNTETGKVLHLNPDKLSVYHYKKDDWMVWAYPMIFAIIDDLMLLEKMKLADLTALDGAISSVRLWKLGNLQEKILPTRAAIQKLASILTENVGSGCFDLIWGPEIELQESKSEIYRFLGADKYTSVFQNIYMGLGIPPTLNGGGDSSSGFSTNFISIKTLIERLKYGRTILLQWLNKELDLVQKAFEQMYGEKYKKPPQIRFDKVTMTDDTQELALYIQLLDRGIISEERVLERFGELPDIERVRLVKEQRERESGKRGQKASPWHDPQFERQILKILAQKGLVTPSELGIDLEERDGDEKTPFEQDNELKLQGLKHSNKLRNDTMRVQMQNNKNTGEPQQGRPLGKKDEKQRKRKVVRPQSPSQAKVKETGELTAEAISKNLWAKDAQKTIADILEPKLLDFYKRKDLRSLTVKEFEECETIKFGVLYNLEPYSKIESSGILQMVKDRKFGLGATAKQLYNELIGEVTKQTGKECKIDIKRAAQCMVYSLLK